MTTACFQWHSDARAFAGMQQVSGQDGPALLHIPASPVMDALEGLHRTLGKSAFCVSDTAPQHLKKLAPSQFATLTGGTSGQPKGIKRSQASWICSFEANSEQFGYAAGDSIAVLGALSHSLALYGILEGLHLGLDVHALPSLTPSHQSSALARHRSTILYATPTQLRLLPATAQLPDLRMILCGGGALTDAVHRHIATVAPNAVVHQFYGAAETSFVTIGDTHTPSGSVGRAYPNAKIEVRDPDAAGTGVIWISSPYLFDGYLDGHSPHTRRDGDWMTVGEYGTLDAAGYLFLRGRAGRMVNIADTAVFPEELEAHIGTLKGVTHCAVLARADAMRGHHLVAVLDGPDSPRMRNRLLRHCKEHNLVTPRAVLFLDPFPLLPSGKPDLQRIAALTGDYL